MNSHFFWVANGCFNFWTGGPDDKEDVEEDGAPDRASAVGVWHQVFDLRRTVSRRWRTESTWILTMWLDTTEPHNAYSCGVGLGGFFCVSKQLLASGTWATHWNCGISRSQGRNWQERSAALGCQDISGLENRWWTSSFDRDLKVDVAASVTRLKLQQVVFWNRCA